MRTARAFDIGHLVDFRPAAYECEKCAALLDKPPFNIDDAKEPALCPVCGVEYPNDKNWRVWEYFKEMGLRLEYPPDTLGHAWGLGAIARNMSGGSETYPPMRGLLGALHEARVLVHFISYGLDWNMLALLRLVGLQVTVRGVVANASPELQMDIRDYKNESERLKIHCIPRGHNWGEVPHQKLVVIDGLLAFTGSANLTTHGWRSAKEGRDMVEVVTDLPKVVDYNNRYFAPTWARFSNIGDRVLEDAQPPF